MYTALKMIIVGAIQNLQAHAGALLPPLLAAMAVLCITYVAARSAHWVLSRAFKARRSTASFAGTGLRFFSTAPAGCAPLELWPKSPSGRLS